MKKAHAFMKKAHARSGRSDHLREDFLTGLSNDRLGLGILAVIRKEKEKLRQTLFARIEQLVDKVLFDSTIARQQT